MIKLKTKKKNKQKKKELTICRQKVKLFVLN